MHQDRAEGAMKGICVRTGAMFCSTVAADSSVDKSFQAQTVQYVS